MVLFPSYVVNSGGFQLYKCAPNSRELELLSKLAHAPPANLKQLVNNGRTYIVPLQLDLDLSPVVDPPSQFASRKLMLLANYHSNDCCDFAHSIPPCMFEVLRSILQESIVVKNDMNLLTFSVELSE